MKEEIYTYSTEEGFAIQKRIDEALESYRQELLAEIKWADKCKFFKGQEAAKDFFLALIEKEEE